MPNPFFSQQGPLGQSRPESIKVRKDALVFGPLSITRANTVPPLDHGRPGDLVIVDNTDNPSIILQSLQTPTSIGLWQKTPFSNALAPSGNTIIGFPSGVSTAGDIVTINGVDVVLNGPNDVPSAVIDINAALIPNVQALNINGALAINENTGGAIVITDNTGSATATLGIYTQDSLVDLANAGIIVNGIWLPVGYTGPISSGTASAPVGAPYLTLANDVNLTSERVLTGGQGVTITDAGPGGTATVDVDISGAIALTEPLDSADEVLVYNASTMQLERAQIADLPGGVTQKEAVQQRTEFIGTAGSNTLGGTVPAGSVVRRITLQILSPYSAGTTITIGDAGNAARLMTAVENDPTEVNTFETTSIFDYVAATQIIVTVGGSPVAGSSRVIVDFIVP